MAIKVMGMKPSDGYSAARKAMPHVMALNSDPTIGKKSGRQPMPAKSPLVAFAKGGAAMKVVNHRTGKSVLKALRSMAPAAMAPVGDMDPTQPPQMMPGGGLKKGGKVKKKMAKGGKAACYAKGGKVKKLAAGGAARTRLKEPMPKPIKKVPYVNGG